MSCDNAIYHSAVDVCLSPNLELGDYVTATEPDVKRGKSLKQSRLGSSADQAKAKGHRHEAQPRTIPDSTEIDPEYVWGDEGPIND
jgi:hypothetical protein